MSPSPLRIIFAGTSRFAVPSLRALSNDAGCLVQAVITQTDKPAGRSKELTPPPVKVAGLELGLRVLQPENIRKEFASLELPETDLLVVVSYGQILSQEILDFPRIAPLNVHASLLPRWRGASPIQHAILAGDATSGVTIQRMVYELDAGPILSRRDIGLSTRETATTLHDTLSALGASLLTETLSNLPTPTAQEGAVTLCTKLSRKDGICDTATMTAEEIDRRVRALTPWPGVTCTIDGTALKLLETSLETTKTSTPLVCAKGSTLHLVRVQPPSKNPMEGAAWARGRRN